MKSKEESLFETPNEALLLKYIIDDVTVDERGWIDGWVDKSVDNEKILIQLARIYYAHKTQQRINNRDTEFAFQKVQKRIKKKIKYRILQRVSVAASLIIGVLGIGSVIYQQARNPEGVMASLVTVQSNMNQRSSLTLPDGTEVHLNAGSTLIYPTHYADNERKVTLDGEAYFKVTHNPQQPFIVGVADNKLNVEVLGTEFNMQAYKEDNEVQTTLVEGSVLLKIQGKSSHQKLISSEKAVYNIQENRLQILNVNTDRETDWMYNRLVFKDTPMAEVLARLSRFYNIEFEVQHQIINTYTFTGKFEDKPLFQVLDYMKISSNINYTITYAKDKNGTKSIVKLTK